MLRIASICLCLVLATSATAQSPAPKRSVEVPAGVKHCPDVTYCKIKDRSLQLDLAVPTVGKGPFPTVVILHGTGAFSGGRKFNLPQAFELAQKGFVAVCVSYRHLATEPFPAAVHDAKCALRWLRTHAKDYQIDADRIGAIGYSGGGCLALLLALAAENRDLEGDIGYTMQSSALQAVVSYFAPTDWSQLVQHPYADWLTRNYVQLSVKTWLGGDISSVADRYRLASPICHVRKGAPPLLLLHGSADRVVPPSQTLSLVEKLKGLGAAVEFEIFKDAPHDFDSVVNETTRRARMLSQEFLATHLRTRETSGK